MQLRLLTHHSHPVSIYLQRTLRGMHAEHESLKKDNVRLQADAQRTYASVSVCFFMRVCVCVL